MGVWKDVGTLPEYNDLLVLNQGIVTVDKNIYSIGGEAFNGSALCNEVVSKVYLADASKDKLEWVELNDLPIELFKPQVVEYNNTIFVLGGFRDWAYHVNNRVFSAKIKSDYTLTKWKECTAITPEFNLLNNTVTVLDGDLYLIGGELNSIPKKSIFKYTIINDNIFNGVKCNDLSFCVSNPFIVNDNKGSFFIFGGNRIKSGKNNKIFHAGKYPGVKGKNSYVKTTVEVPEDIINFECINNKQFLIILDGDNKQTNDMNVKIFISHINLDRTLNFFKELPIKLPSTVVSNAFVIDKTIFVTIVVNDQVVIKSLNFSKYL